MSCALPGSCFSAGPKAWFCCILYCHEGGFTVLGGLVDDWPSYLSRDGVHPSRFGNKVLTEYLYQVACTLSIHLERSHIQQCYKETRAPSSWTSWTRQDKHPCHHRGGVSPTWFAYFHFFSCSKWTFHSTSSCLVSQQTKTLQGAGFSLSGGVRVRCKGSKAWWTWDNLPSPIFHGTSVPSRGKAKQRSGELMIPGLDASTTCVRRTRRATQKHESAHVMCFFCWRRRGQCLRSRCARGCLPVW
ncbi:uncharacterized protein LOC125942484 isoform X1 [Dermacentor silvarum]|uniref:uncharacterized protein LOC125942484 isoform X1 n=1 Tax=Dermacentor silvarum TaxID=543639 RepID=UPI0021011D83|nr:uncharacterized protein LOC125942484 isoform X1 [Dermacentor silvarum]